MSTDLAELYPGDLCLLLIPLCKPIAGHTHRNKQNGEWIAEVCKKPGKKPQAGNNWNAKATTRYLSGEDREQHIGWIASRHADGDNVGLTVPAGVIVLDGDSPEAVEWLERHLLTAPRQNTGRGAHFFCKAPSQQLKPKSGVPVAGTEGVLVDLRTAGQSQVVVEPSVHVEGTAYRWVRRLPEDLSALPECPQEVVDGFNQMIAERRRQESSAPINGGGTGPKFPKTTRNDRMIALAYQIRERSLTEEEFEAEVYEANENRCEPPMDRSEVASIIQSARRKTKLLSFTIHTRPAAAPVDQGGLRPGVVPFRPARSLEDIEGLSVDNWVKGVIPKDSTGFVYGPHSSGKTFWAMRLMAAVADGEPFLGRKTSQGLAFYLCGEGQIGIDRRTRALRLKGHLDSDNLLVRPLIPNLLEDSPVTEAIELIRLAKADLDLPVALIVFDTLSRAMPGGDENPGSDTSKAFSSADRIRQAFPGATALIVAHTGKDETRGLRGHSNQAANAEFLISIRREGQHANRTSSWRVEKQKDGETTAAENFELVQVDLEVKDEDGDPITSCVAEPAEGSVERWEQDASLGKQAAGCWEVIQGLFGAPGDFKTTTREAVSEALRQKGLKDSTRRTWLSNGLKKLIARGFIQEDGGLIRIGLGQLAS